MKNFLKSIIALTLLLSVGPLSAQESVEWGEPKLTEGSEGIYTLSVTVEIPEDWHIYDMQSYKDGPMPTTFTFAPTQGVELVGGVRSVEDAEVVWDDVFGMSIGYYSDKVTFEQDIKLADDRASAIHFEAEWMMCNDMNCMPPDVAEFDVKLPAASKGAAAATTTTAVSSGARDRAANDTNMWVVILEAMLWGFAALLTPCVFPMVPMTISFFMKRESSAAKGRLKALLYGAFIVMLYTLPIAVIILITYFVGGDAVTANIFNWIATHWLPNIIFFVVFMVFAASFFGAFELTLPSSWVNQSDSKADKQSLAGIFFLALTLVLVSFSCTGPIVGSVLIKSTSGAFWQPIITMLAFSVAFALPFVVIAVFPSLMQRLPKSGGWLSSVKIVLGFLEIALGLKFLSVADQTYHWGILDREVYLAIWIVVFALLGLYLLGKLRFEHEESVETIGVGRLSASIVVFSFVVYLIPGMWGAPLKGLSGYLPPLQSQEFVMGSGVVMQSSSTASSVDGDMAQLPLGLTGFHNIEQAQEYANKVNKPLFIDFTGHGCVNCREMEQRVWSDDRVLSLLRDEYVIVALYMDDRTELPSSQWITTSSGRVLKTVGRVNSHLALERFGLNSQPYYIPLGRDGEELVTPRAYNLDVEAYIDFLERGIAAYRAN